MASRTTNGAGFIKPEPKKRASRSSRAAADDDFEENDDEEFRVAMDDVEGVPIYRDGELMVRQVNEPLIVNRKLEQLFSKSKPSQVFVVYRIHELLSEPAPSMQGRSANYPQASSRKDSST